MAESTGMTIGTDTEKKLAIVFGSGPGIGEATVNTLADAGWEVVGLGRDDCDLADLAAVAALAEDLAERYPRIDAIIHAAGIWHDENEAFVNRDLEDYDPAWIAATMNVGITSFMMLTARLMPNLPRDGAVVGISAMFEGELRNNKGDAASGWLPYYTSKRAMEDFLVGLAQDYPIGPRVYGVSPGDTMTPAMEKYFPKVAKDSQPAHSVSLLVEHLLKGDSPYHSGDIVAVKAKTAGTGYHS